MAEPGLPVASVARRLGVAPATLRTWDRRYGVGPSEHTAGAHRRYTAEDLARLEVMQRLLREGVSARDAARHALGEQAPDPAPQPRPLRVVRAGDEESAEAVVRGIGRASVALDGAAVTAMVQEQIRERGVVVAYEQVLRPVLAVAGERWAATGRGVEIEHLLSESITSALQQTVAMLPRREEPRSVLLASPPEEQHCLPQHVLSAALAERGVSSRVLGSSLPVEALVDAVRRTGPSALFLWSQLPSTADPGVLAALPVTRPRTEVVVGGPGWDAVALPDRVSRAGSLSGALSLVLEAAGH